MVLPFVMPDFLKLEKDKDILEDFTPLKGDKWKKALGISNEILKIISILSGQWPHTSYAVPGGVMSDPINTDIVEAISITDSVIRFLRKRS